MAFIHQEEVYKALDQHDDASYVFCPPPPFATRDEGSSDNWSNGGTANKGK